MDIENCILGRRSVRRFRKGSVPDDVIMRGIELAESAPNAGNLQEREYIVVRNQGTKERLSAAALQQPQPSQADVVVVFCANLDRMGDYGRRGTEIYVPQDVAAAIENFLLYIHSQGFGAVWIGAFTESEVSAALDLPKFIKPLALVPVGLPGEVPKTPSKRPHREKVHNEKWD